MKYIALFELIVLGVPGLITALTVRSWLFWLIQGISANLFIPGLLVSIFAPWHITDGKGHWSRLFWLFDNDEDGIFGTGPITRLRAIYWAGVRNYVNNLRYVRGVSKVGRPLWRKEWTSKVRTLTLFGRTWTVGGRYYAQAGWNSSGFPVLSAGPNVNPW